MVFQNKRDAAAGGVLQTRGDAPGGVGQTLLSREFRAPLSAQHAAVAAAELGGHVDPPLLKLDLLAPKLRVGMREVGRATEHRNRQAMIGGYVAELPPRTRVGQFQEAGVEFE